MPDPIRLPASIPPQAVVLQGLRIAKGPHRADLPCYLTYSDRDGLAHEIAIRFQEMLEILNYLNEIGQNLPFKVRYDS